MKAKCDECNQEFDVKFKTRRFGRGFEETYFRCNACHVHTTCYITNGKARKLQRELHEESDAFKRLAIYEKISEIMDELKEKYGRR